MGKNGLTSQALITSDVSMADIYAHQGAGLERCKPQVTLKAPDIHKRPDSQLEQRPNQLDGDDESATVELTKITGSFDCVRDTVPTDASNDMSNARPASSRSRERAPWTESSRNNQDLQSASPLSGQSSRPAVVVLRRCDDAPVRTGGFQKIDEDARRRLADRRRARHQD